MARPTQFQKLSLQLDADNKKLKAKLAATRKGMGGLKGMASELGGAIAGAFVIGGIANFVRQVFTLSSEFGFMMSRVQALTGATPKLTAKMRELAQTLGKKTQFTALEAGEAMTFLAQAGLNANKIISAMPSTLELAAAGQISLAEAADISTNVMAAYSLEAENLGRVNDIIANTTTNANTNVLEFAEAFKMVGPLAKSSGQSIEDMSAAIGLLANAGIKGTMAGTQLRAMLAKLQNPSRESEKLLRKFGIVTMDEATGKMRRMNDILIDMRKAGIRTKDMFKIFDLRAATSATILTELSGSFEDFVDVVGRQGTAADIAAKQMDNLKGDTLRLDAAWKGLMLSMGEQSDGILRGTIQILTDFVNVLGKAAQGVLGLDVSESIANHLEGFNDGLDSEKAADIEKFTKRVGELKREITEIDTAIETANNLPWWERAGSQDASRFAVKRLKDLKSELAILTGVLDVVGPKIETAEEKLKRLAKEAGEAAAEAAKLRATQLEAATAAAELQIQTDKAATALRDNLTIAAFDANKALGELFKDTNFLIPPMVLDTFGVAEFISSMENIQEIQDERFVKAEELKLKLFELAEAERMVASDEVIEGYTNLAGVVSQMANGIANAKDNWAALGAVAISGLARIAAAVKKQIDLINALRAAKKVELMASRAAAVGEATEAGAGILFPGNLIAIATGVAAVLATIAPFIGSFANGIDSVPRTGMALVHKGEKITPATQNKGGGRLEVIVSGTDLKFIIDEENRRVGNTG